jgi:DNA polymerase
MMPGMSRRLRYLQAIDIPVWVRRHGAPAAEIFAPAMAEAPAMPAPIATLPPADSVATPPIEAEPAQTVMLAVAEAAAAPLPPAAEEAEEQPLEPMAALLRPLAGLGWDELESRVRGCTACELCQSRTQTVFGVGDRKAAWMVVGEAPGQDEDAQGEPFVGRAGQLLNLMLQAVGLRREQVYIANVLKCRPPANRNPSPQEIAQCSGFLHRQIELVQPRLLLAAGRFAIQEVLGREAGTIGDLRGRVHFYRERIPLVVTYHPAYLLRRPSEKAKVWQDLQLAWRTVHA